MKEENQSSDGNAAKTPQGIFSSPDLSVSSENLEEIKPELSEENESRIASAFAKTDATQKHDQLADQMAEQDAVSGTVIPATNSNTSTATGDIRLPGRKKRSKLPLLILAVLVVLGVVGGVVWWMRGSGENVSLSDTFGQYVNYLLYGTNDKTELSEPYSINNEYTIFSTVYSPSEEQTAYFEQLDSLSTNVIDALTAEKTSGDIREQIESLLLSVSAWEEAVIFYDSVENLAHSFEEGGTREAYVFAEKQYDRFANSNNTVIQEVGRALLDAQNLRIGFFELLANNGCAPLDESDECIEVADNLALQSDLGYRIDMFVEEARVNASIQLDEILPSIWEIEKALSAREGTTS